MKRRDTLAAAVALGTVASATSIQAQVPEKMRRVGVLMGYTPTDSEAQSRLAMFKTTLASLGWSEGRNLRLETRWSGGDPERASLLARELVGLKPDVILSSTTPTTAALRKETSTIPIVFTVVGDPIGSGFVKSLPRPGGNVTGFTNLESSLAAKWVEMLKEIAPRVKQVAMMFTVDTAPSAEYYLQPLKAAASRLGVTIFSFIVRSESDVEAAISGIGGQPNTGLIVMADSFIFMHRKTLIALIARHKVPAVYIANYFVIDGGLIAYGVDVVDLFRRAAPYVDQILRGSNVTDLPVQQPTRFPLAINRKTATALGLPIPPTLFVRADEVIE